MARARNIKPGFFKNEVLAELTPLTRLLFAGLWCLADREGRLEDRPKRIKADIFPYDNCNVDKKLNHLRDKGFVLRYQVDGERYIQVLNFNKHQNPHIKEQASLIPAPCKHHANTMQTPDKHGSCPADSLSLDSLSLDSLLLIPDSPIPIKDIVEYLNFVCGTTYKSTSKTTIEHIKARWKEGFRLADFEKVIDNKFSDWFADKEYVKFLRPSTLFGTKFESYLNQKQVEKPVDVPAGWDGIKEWGKRKGVEIG